MTTYLKAILYREEKRGGLEEKSVFMVGLVLVVCYKP